MVDVKLKSKEMRTGMHPSQKFSEMQVMMATNTWPAAMPWKIAVSSLHFAMTHSCRLTAVLIEANVSMGMSLPAVIRPVYVSIPFAAPCFARARPSSIPCTPSSHHLSGNLQGNVCHPWPLSVASWPESL